MLQVGIAGLRKDYNGKCILGPIDLQVEAGEVLAILGCSGSGKTTLLRLLAGLETPTAGEVYLGGFRATRWPAHQRDIAMVPQKPVLYPGRRVRKQLRQEATIQTVREREIIEVLGLGHLLDRRPAELSGGEIQRVAIGRALLREARILLLDEPLANLDGPRRWELRAQLPLLQGLTRATILYVTHDQEEACDLTDRLAILDQGELLQVGIRDVLFQQPHSVQVAQMVGWPPINLLPGKVAIRENRIELESSDRVLPLPEPCPGLAGVSVLAGFRPESLRVGNGPLSFEVERTGPTHQGGIHRYRLERWTIAGASEIPGGAHSLRLEIAGPLFLFDAMTGKTLYSMPREARVAGTGLWTDA